MACQQELKELHRQLQNATFHANDRRTQIDQLKQLLAQKQKQIDDLVAQLAVANKQLSDLQDEQQAAVQKWDTEHFKILQEAADRSHSLATLKTDMTAIISDLTCKLQLAQAEVGMSTGPCSCKVTPAGPKQEAVHAGYAADSTAARLLQQLATQPGYGSEAQRGNCYLPLLPQVAQGGAV